MNLQKQRNINCYMGYETKYSTDKTSTLFTLCGCGSEVLMIQYDHDIDLADLCILATISSHKMSLWQKFRYMYQIIVKGFPYKDQIVLDRESLKEIRNFLNHTLS